MNEFGRISVCGSSAAYNSEPKNIPRVPMLQSAFEFKQLKMEGFIIVSRWAGRFDESFSENLKWIREGKLKYPETITKGFENQYNAFIRVLQGETNGKAVLKL